MTTRSRKLLVLMVLALFPAEALAVVHLMVVDEVFVGHPGEDGAAGLTPDQRAQYVLLRMTARSQIFTSGTVLRVEDAAGNLLGRFGTFTANMGIAGALGCGWPNCPAIVIGTQAAANLFSFPFDQIVDGQAGRVALPQAGGRVCFVNSLGTTVYDCVAWGPFDCTVSGNCAGANTARIGDLSGNACDLDFGVPGAAGTGLLFGRSLRRTAFSCAAKENAAQFSVDPPVGFPHAVNNAGQNDNVDADGDGLINRFDCDDASTQIWWPSPEVADLQVADDAVGTISWRSQAATGGPGITYDVVRGTLALLAGFADAACYDPDTPLDMTFDASLPLPGDGFYYAVRGGGGACAGTYGPGRAALDVVCP